MNILKKVGLVIAGVAMSFSLFTSTAYAAEYKILPNDSLYKISTLFKTSVSTIKTDNNLSSTTIYPGKVLEVRAQEYTIKSGDTLYLIAKNYGISLDALRRANNKWDNLIYPGQKIILPGIKPSGNTTEAAKSGTVIPYTAKEVDLLARLITAETTGQPYDAMVGVGGVVVNRVKSPDWPNSISTVINQVIGEYYQFTPVKNGYINNPPSDIALKAAWAALYGADPSKGAMFYFDDSSTNQWMWSKPQTAYIGHMVFVK